MNLFFMRQLLPLCGEVEENNFTTNVVEPYFNDGDLQQALVTYCVFLSFVTNTKNCPAMWRNWRAK